MKKTEDLYHLRDSYSAVRSEYDNLRTEFDIAKLKFMSEKKNNQMVFDI